MDITITQRQEEEERYQEWWTKARPLFDSNDRERFSGWPIPQFTDTPWASLTKPLSQAKVALLCSGGLYLSTQPPYESANPEGDYTWRRIPLDADPKSLQIAHTHYDHAAAEEDINVVHPVQRLQELVKEGVIGELSDPVFTWYGYVSHLARFRDTVARDLAACVADVGADAALLVPV